MNAEPRDTRRLAETMFTRESRSRSSLVRLTAPLVAWEVDRGDRGLLEGQGDSPPAPRRVGASTVPAREQVMGMRESGVLAGPYRAA